MQSNFQPDSIVQAIVDKFILRAQKGKEKYGTDMDRNDLSTNQWIEHAQDELMDGIIYLEKLKKDFPSPPIVG
jgi:hypothetical protein